jgi:hypothetical protein
MTKSIKATIRVEILNEEVGIDDICDPLERCGWAIRSAWIEDEDGNIADW